MIKIKAKRSWKIIKDKVIFDIKINGQKLRIKYDRESVKDYPESYFKNFIKNEIYGQIKIDIV